MKLERLLPGLHLPFRARELKRASRPFGHCYSNNYLHRLLLPKEESRNNDTSDPERPTHFGSSSLQKKYSGPFYKHGQLTEGHSPPSYVDEYCNTLAVSYAIYIILIKNDILLTLGREETVILQDQHDVYSPNQQLS